MDDAHRLKCYDDLAGPIERAADTPPVKPSPSVEPSALASQWDLQHEEAHLLLPHKQNYVTVRYSNNPNQQPVSANFGAAQATDLDRAELKYQFPGIASQKTPGTTIRTSRTIWAMAT